MIRIKCRTNLDLFNEVWPTQLPAVPRIGEEIESKTNWGGGFHLSLKVINVRYEYQQFDRSEEWIPVVELHMTDTQRLLKPPPDVKAETGSIVAFYHWYAPLVGKLVSSFI